MTDDFMNYLDLNAKLDKQIIKIELLKKTTGNIYIVCKIMYRQYIFSSKRYPETPKGLIDFVFNFINGNEMNGSSFIIYMIGEFKL